MLCYYCMEDGHDNQAVALCHCCGGGVCCNHVLEVRYASEPTVLLGPPLAPRRELLCRRCWEDRIHPTEPIRATGRPKVDRAEEPLPEATDAVQIAEAFLRGKKGYLQGHPQHLLQTLWPLLAGRFKRVRSILPRVNA